MGLIPGIAAGLWRRKRSTFSSAAVFMALTLGAASASWTAEPGTLTDLRAIKALSNQEASQGRPVAFEATITFSRESEGTLFVQDGDAAIYVNPPADASFVLGDRVLITGNTRADFSASVVGKTITLLHHGVLPVPVSATYDEMISARLDCILVSARAVIRTVDPQMRSDTRSARLPMHPLARVLLQAEGGYIEALVDGDDPGSLSNLLDAEVVVTGIATFGFDGKMQPIGVQIDVSSHASIRLVNRGKSDPWSIPVTSMSRILAGYHVHDLTRRTRVHGTITYYQPGSAVVMQDGAKSLWISTQTRSPLVVGDIADAIGFPDVHEGLLALSRAEIKDSGTNAPISPKPVTVKQLMASSNLFDLVSVEGVVATAVHQTSQDDYVLVNGSQVFTAIYRHPISVLPPMKQIPVGSTVRVNGICILEDSNPFGAQVPFGILLRSTDDILIVANPSVVSTGNLILVVGLLLAGLFAVGARGWFIERKVRRQTAAMAYLEQRRSRILEDINNSRPLASIIEQITELVSFKMQGAPCWCRVADGAQMGNCPSNLGGFRVVREEIPAHSGSALGSIFAAFDALAKPQAVESEALSIAAALAAIAIETSRLYTDLMHRSEFDQLTNTHNRFSLDKLLDSLIADTRRPFGIIYMDLDKFKEVNDLYGHLVGDQYLQEVALRMKSQLRSHDRLARLGGDEFAALVPVVRNRAEVEEIAQRLERCLDLPFIIEGCTVYGATSVGIAVYPEDGVDKDTLFRIADAAMYSAKNSHRPVEQTPAHTAR